MKETTMNRCDARSAAKRQCWLLQGHAGDHFAYGDSDQPKVSWPNTAVFLSARNMVTKLGGRK